MCLALLSVGGPEDSAARRIRRFVKKINWRRTRTIVATGAVLATVALALPRPADARGRGFHGGYHRGPVFVGGFYRPYFAFGFGPYWGPYWGGPYGWGPWGPYAYGPPGGIDMSAAFQAGYGAVDLNVKPGQAEVWVDGKYVAEARDLDGYPSYLWLPEGAHHVFVYKGGYARFEEDIEVQRGFRKDLKVRLEKGESQPPGQKPGKVPAKSEPPKTEPGTNF